MTQNIKIKEEEGWLQQLDLLHPEINIIPEQANLNQMVTVQAHLHNKNMKEIIDAMNKMVTEDNIDQQNLSQKLLKVSQESMAVTEMITNRIEEKNKISQGNYFNRTRVPICVPPKEIASGTKNEISDSALKLLTTFKGDSSEESENLRLFLRTIFDIAITNNLTETCTVAMLQRKLAGTARKIIDSFVADCQGKVTLVDIILKLEDRFCQQCSPELANTRLKNLLNLLRSDIESQIQ